MKKLFTTIFYLNIVFTQNVFLKQFSDQFADIAEKANPAVVTILTAVSYTHLTLPTKA